MRIRCDALFARQRGRRLLPTWLAACLIAASYSGPAAALSPPTLSKVFGAAQLPLNGVTTLSFMIQNPNLTDINAVSFSDALPSGLVVATPNQLTGSCGGGTISATAGSSTISLSGAVLAASASCTFSVGVLGTSAGLKTNVTGQIIAAGTGPGATATASLTVVAPPRLLQFVVAHSIPLRGSTSLEFQVVNDNAVNLTGVAFTDFLPAGLIVATPNRVSNSCTSGTITANPGSSSFGVSGLTVAAQGSGQAFCNISVGVTAVQVGLDTNATGQITSSNGGTGSTSDTVTIQITNGPVNSHDFDGSGASDIVWRQSGGATAVWIMEGAIGFRSFILQGTSFGTVPPNWSLVGQRDFDNDGLYDLLWRDTNTGTVAMWLSGVFITQTGSLGTVPTNWNIAGACDLNGDGTSDLVWRDTAAGTVAIWLLSGLQVIQTGGLGVVPLNWTIVGTGDFDDDARCDILWRDSNTGTVTIWLMNGLQVKQTGSLGAVPNNWSIVATGDFNGDGHADILWRDANSGTVVVWLMNGFQVMQSASLGAVGLNWIVAQTGDYNVDEKSDILWRDPNTGAVAMWFMNGVQVAATMGFGTVTADWTIQGMNAD